MVVLVKKEGRKIKGFIADSVCPSHLDKTGNTPILIRNRLRLETSCLDALL